MKLIGFDFYIVIYCRSIISMVSSWLLDMSFDWMRKVLPTPWGPLTKNALPKGSPSFYRGISDTAN